MLFSLSKIRPGSISSSVRAFIVKWAPAKIFEISRIWFAQVPLRRVGAPSPYTNIKFCLNILCEKKKYLFLYPLHTCQFTTRYLVKSVLSFVILTNAYKILPVFNSSVNSVRPPSPVDTTLSTFVCASYPNNALKNAIISMIKLYFNQNKFQKNGNSPIGVGFWVNHIFPCIDDIVSIFFQIHWHLVALI